MTPNERTARTFAEQFTPPLTVCATERINNMAVPDAWMVAYHDNALGIGITAVAYHGGLHAYIEAAGKDEIAERAGQVMAKALGLFRKPPLKWADQLPEWAAKLNFDGVDVLPTHVDAEALIWMYRTACLRMLTETEGPKEE